MISALDDAVGAVLDELDRLGLAHDTLVVFLSDNGCASYTGVCSCEPLRGGKFTYFEGGVRVPFMMRWPAGLPSGAVFGDPVSSLDLVPTLLGAVGGSLPTDRAYDGVDLRPYIRGQQATPHGRLFWRTGPLIAMREGAHKMWQSRDGAFSYLFDLAADPNEADNLASSDPQRLDALTTEFVQWEQAMGTPAWDPRLAPIPACGVNFTLPY
jgi:arylsulfatase A-like enzyme